MGTELIVLFGLLFFIGIAVFVLKILALVFLVRKGVDLYRQHQQAFDQALQEQQHVLQSLGNRGGAAPPAHLQSQWAASFMRAQRELNQLDDMRRTMAEDRLSAMKSEAASMGLFL